MDGVDSGHRLVYGTSQWPLSSPITSWIEYNSRSFQVEVKLVNELALRCPSLYILGRD